MPSESRHRRITLVTDELLGYVRTGGIGTATTFLALALGRMGHDVDVLYVGEPKGGPDSPWAELYQRMRVHIRELERSDERTEPASFARMRDVERELERDERDLVIVQDLAAPAYTALRKRQLGLAFPRTRFIVYCHGTRLWITDMADKVRVLPGALTISILEQASVELADTVVSPSSYLLGWMRGQRWQVPKDARVIPYLTQATALGERQPRFETNGRPVERLAFFGRLEERKGLRPFAAGLNALPQELLRKVELEFVGGATPAWPPARIEALLSRTTREALRGVSFATELDQPEALNRLARPGTLAVMPSRGETFSNAVYECLRHGIPFIASDAGAPPELVAEQDRERVLFEPTADGVAAALTRVLESPQPWRPAEPAFEASASYDAWNTLVTEEVTERQTTPGPAADEFELLLGQGEHADEELLETLRRAQAASGADIVTCGLRLPSGVHHFFLGDPGGLGLVANQYGTAALVRRTLLPDGYEREARWSLLARLVLQGASIVSVPEVLVERRTPLDDAGALDVARTFEQHLPRPLRSLARLAAGLAARPAQAPRKRRLFRRR